MTNKQVIDWKTEPVNMKRFPLTKTESLLIRPNDNTPMGYFRLLLTDEFLQDVVYHTNYNAIQIFLSETTKEQSNRGMERLKCGRVLSVFGCFPAHGKC